MKLNLDYFGDWVKVFNKDILYNSLVKLSREYNNKLICPNKINVFKAFKLCQLNDLKLVMLGQDPYPQKDIATGILFGNKKNTPDNKLSPSLKIIKEAVINFEVPHNYINFDETLESWATQGILMLNSALTCEVNKPGSHSLLWRPFISSLLQNLSNYNTGIIYVLFGKQAQSFKPYIDARFNHILEINHPAYYARTNSKMPYNFFREINKKVNYFCGDSIEWYKEIN